MMMRHNYPPRKRAATYFYVSILLLASTSLFCLASSSTSSSLSDDDNNNDNNHDGDHHVTVLGLGSMGTAVLKCLAKQKQQKQEQEKEEEQEDYYYYKVHAWNRGVAKREAVADIAVVYDTATAAAQPSNTILVVIDDWEATMGIVRELADYNNNNNKNQTIVLFSTYTPLDISVFQKELEESSSSSSGNNNSSSRITLVGGAIVGVPQTICSPQALILTTSEVKALEHVGRVVSLPSIGNDDNNNIIKNNDVGGAALVNMALILVITFGIAGQELAMLMFRQYGVTNDEFWKIYITLAAEIGPALTKMLIPLSSKALLTRHYQKPNSYVPAGVFSKVLQMQSNFMVNHLGIAEDTFLASYINYLKQIPNQQDNGPAAWTELAVTTTATTSSSSSETTLGGTTTQDEL